SFGKKCPFGVTYNWCAGLAGVPVLQRGPFTTPVRARGFPPRRVGSGLPPFTIPARSRSAVTTTTPPSISARGLRDREAVTLRGRAGRGAADRRHDDLRCDRARAPGRR